MDILGAIRQSGKRSTTTLNDMREFFKDASDAKGNPVIYTVDFVEEDEISYAVTTINPGKIGKENFMTKGHYHIKNVSEVYYPLSGKGVIVLRKGNKRKKIIMKKGVFHFIPAGWAHRTINSGNKKLIFLSIYPTDSGHNYDKIKKEGF